MNIVRQVYMLMPNSTVKKKNKLTMLTHKQMFHLFAVHEVTMKRTCISETQPSRIKLWSPVDGLNNKSPVDQLHARFAVLDKC